MAFLQVTVYSNVLEMEVGLNVILPQQTNKKVGTNSQGALVDVPVLYLLHGMGGNQTAWQRKTSIERYVSAYGLAVIMPSTDLGWYTDTQYDLQYWTFIAEELPQLCHELFPQLSHKREKTFAIGLSMGGYGAIKLGLRKPERFAAVVSLSGALALAEAVDTLLTVRKKAYWEGIFGPLETIAGSFNDPIQMLREIDPKKAPQILIACGTQDYLYPANQYFVEQAQKYQLVHTYLEGPGEHNWVFWDQWIQTALDWLPLAK
ncbi:MAG: alpha/beta hydrolase [Enterococcus sp.]